MGSCYKAKSNSDYEAAALLFKEYAEWLNIDLSFQHFDEELQELKQMYGEPGGAIFLDNHGGVFRGCVAVRRLTTEAAELKRMYIKPGYRRQKIAETLLTAAVNFAKEKNYASIKLDTLDNMNPAITLYKKFGFREVPSYYHNPNTNTLYFEKSL